MQVVSPCIQSGTEHESKLSNASIILYYVLRCTSAEQFPTTRLPLNRTASALQLPVQAASAGANSRTNPRSPRPKTCWTLFLLASTRKRCAQIASSRFSSSASVSQSRMRGAAMSRANRVKLFKMHLWGKEPSLHFYEINHIYKRIKNTILLVKKHKFLKYQFMK